MGFRQIGQIALDGVSLDLQMKIERAVEGSACEALTLRSTAGKATTAREGGSGQPSMLREEGAATAIETGEKDRSPKAPAKVQEVSKVPTRIAPRVMLQGRAGMSMVTVTAATKGKPLPSAVIIDIAVWKAAHHESSQTRIAAHDRMTSPPASHSKR